MELRESGRYEAQGKVRVHWRGDEGATYERVGRVSEVSRSGMCLVLENRIPIGTEVRIESTDVKVAGLAIVRHCRNKGMAFRLGLQFSGGLKRLTQIPGENVAPQQH